MPELPEVETTARLIRPGVEGRAIKRVTVDWERTLGGASVTEFEKAVVGARVTEVTRRAKYVVMPLARRGKPAGGLLVHLRMTGRLVVTPTRDPIPDYRKVSLGLDRGSLHFLDVRKFGRFSFHDDLTEALAHLGPEPLDGSLVPEEFVKILRARKRRIKPLLLDQGFLAGLGNIYVDESLHAARIHPLELSHRVSPAKAKVLFAAIQRILRGAIKREGSSFDEFYRTPEGQPGAYQHLFKVYGREGQPCATCGRGIARMVVGQRGTHLCRSCQKLSRQARESLAR